LIETPKIQARRKDSYVIDSSLPQKERDAVKKSILSAVLGLATLAATSGLAAADPARSPGAGEPAVRPAAAAPLTHDSLLKVLQDMGYSPRVEKTQTGAIYHLTVERDGWTYRLQLALSSNQQFLWISTGVVTLPSDEKVPADRLLRLLEENDRIGPMFISYYKKFHQLQLVLPLYNGGGITPVVLRGQLEDFMATTRKVVEMDKELKPAAGTSVGDKR
jgi:hypothetical protein